jgi:copper transport protein
MISISSEGTLLFFSKQKFFLRILIIGITLLFCFYHSLPSFTAYSQVGLFEESSSLMPQTETVTSYYDALLKVPLIISQTAVVGLAFSHMFLQRVIRNRIQLGKGWDNTSTEIIDDTSYLLRPVQRLFIILLSCGIATLVSATFLLLLQAISLSSELGVDIATTFTILLSTPVGPVWNIRVITSLIIIACSIIYYTFEKKSVMKKHYRGDNIDHNQQGETKSSVIPITNILLFVIMLSGSINIFSNSIVSHNTALSFLPSLAISMDWLHFMAVSIWVGGLFYISTILIMTIRTIISENGSKSGFINKSVNDNYSASITSYFLALLLPYFSLIATISLGIIGITGLYMAWIHLHTADALFVSSYGNILIIKLLLASPMVILGAYHQIKLHGSLMLIASAKNAKHKLREERNKIPDTNSAEDLDIYRNISLLQHDPSTRFSKTIKLESFIGIGVLIAASFLTITSPPSISLQESLSTEGSVGQEGQQQDYIPSFDSFTILAIISSVAVLSGSIIYFKKSKQQVRNTIAYFESKSE